MQAGLNRRWHQTVVLGGRQHDDRVLAVHRHTLRTALLRFPDDLGEMRLGILELPY